jgi:multicomponent K+:H+ antiporter subunit A
MPAVLVGPLLAVAAKAALLGPTPGELPAYTLALWHGFNLPLLMSGLALVGGTVLYFVLQRRVNLHTLDRAPATHAKGGREFFAAGLVRVLQVTARATLRLQTGRLQDYLCVLVVMAVVAGALPFMLSPAQSGPTVQGQSASLPFIIVWGIGMVATVATVVAHRQRLLALLLLGAVGLAVSLAFVYFSAPDLALTQLLVEVATIMLMMLALHWLPERNGVMADKKVARTDGADSTARRGRDALIALAAGAGVAALAWMVLGRPFDSISPYFLETAVAQGGGANAVNVIIVDYRGIDTLGEITVMGIAALIMHALLTDWKPDHPLPAGGSLIARSGDVHPLMLAVVSRLLLPLAVLVSVYFYLRGHNLPGGGFIAGLMLAIALVLQFVANGQAYVQSRMGTDFQPWIGWGLLLAGACGIGSWFFGAPFMTTTYDYPVWPLVGAVPLASAAIFDLGVFLTVTGATMVALLSIARLSATRLSSDQTARSQGSTP